jgi:hypothetical protein
MRLGFKGWKILLLSRVLEIMNKYPDKKGELEPLVHRIYRLKSRDLVPFLMRLYDLSRDIPELQELYPSPDEVKQWLESRSGN